MSMEIYQRSAQLIHYSFEVAMPTGRTMFAKTYYVSTAKLPVGSQLETCVCSLLHPSKAIHSCRQIVRK